MHIFGEAVTTGTAIFFILAVGLALGFECVNGFHDTANAVATVIYTNSLKPVFAVVWSGCCNLLGVLVSSGTVAYGIVALLPVELVLNVQSNAGFAMIFAILISAIIWNVGTWYLGLPASSSHTMIGSILGVGLAYGLLNGEPLSKGLNWDQVKAVLLSLAISPLIGFVGAALLLLIVKSLIKDPDLYNSPKDGQPPVPWIRGLLILTCTGVSFAHGSNDGQKGMGLLMLITVGILPGIFALKIDTKPVQIAAIITQSQKVSAMMQTHADGMKLTNDSTATKLLTEYIHTEGKFSPPIFAALAEKTSTVAANLRGVTSFRSLSSAQRITLRTDAYLLSDSISKMDKKKILKGPDDKLAMSYSSKELGNMSQYIPVWVKVAVAFALGFGTMVGWKRIVVTVGERIGKKHLTYAEGACAELVTMATIGGATSFGLPASTTHVLASGIAGTMEANGSGLQTQTIRNIVLAWVLTLPVCILLGATIFSGTLYVILHMLKIQ